MDFIARRTPPSVHDGGYFCVLDPNRDAREVAPVWDDEEHKLVRLVPMDQSSASSARFDLWRLPGWRTLIHDGANLRVCTRTPRESFCVHLHNALVDNQPFAYLLPANDELNEAQRVVERFAQFNARKNLQPRNIVVERPSRAILYHVRALQALDGVSCGASQRHIARVLMGDDVVATQWSADSALRAHVRALIQRGRLLMSGGYRTLISNNNQFTQGVNL